MIQVTEPEINRQLALSIHYFTSAKIITSNSTPSHKNSPLLGYYRGQEGPFSCGHPLGWPQDIRMLWKMMRKLQQNCDASIRKYWIKNPRKRLWSDLHSNRTTGMFFLSLIFLFVSCQPLFFYCRVTCSMWPKTSTKISPDLHHTDSVPERNRTNTLLASKPRYPGGKDSLSQLGPDTHFWTNECGQEDRVSGICLANDICLQNMNLRMWREKGFKSRLFLGESSLESDLTISADYNNIKTRRTYITYIIEFTSKQRKNKSSKLHILSQSHEKNLFL